LGNSQPPPAEGSAESSGLGAWVKRHWLLSAAVVALVTSSVGFLVNRFGPEVIEGLSGEPPLRLVVSRVDPADGDRFAFPVAVSRDELPPPSSCLGIQGWLTEHGAIDAGRSPLTIAIEGLSSSPVLINSMRANVESRREPVSNAVLSCATEGELGLIQVGFNLDEQPPVARWILEDGGLGEPYFQTSTIRVEEGEVLAMGVSAFAEQCFCTWTIEFDIVVDGERQTLSLDNHGEPFQTTAVVTVPAQRIILYSGEWGICDGEFSCFPDGDGIPGGPPAQPISEDDLQQMREEGTLQVLPPYE
jgi:hypothetical protein